MFIFNTGTAPNVSDITISEPYVALQKQSQLSVLLHLYPPLSLDNSVVDEMLKS